MNSAALRSDDRLQPRVCVIGAGPCGLTALKNLLAAGLSGVVCYDESDAIGGNWVFREEGDRTSVYFSTHIISSKRLSEFEDYPMPADYPDFPSHRRCGPMGHGLPHLVSVPRRLDHRLGHQPVSAALSQDDASAVREFVLHRAISADRMHLAARRSPGAYRRT